MNLNHPLQAYKQTRPIPSHVLPLGAAMAKRSHAIHFKYAFAKDKLSLRYVSGLGAIFYYGNKKVVFKPGEYQTFADWRKEQFKAWVLSHSLH